jgi:hypothetical protein
MMVWISDAGVSVIVPIVVEILSGFGPERAKGLYLAVHRSTGHSKDLPNLLRGEALLVEKIDEGQQASLLNSFGVGPPG